jgi:hypothetical protein
MGVDEEITSKDYPKSHPGVIEYLHLYLKVRDVQRTIADKDNLTHPWGKSF